MQALHSGVVEAAYGDHREAVVRRLTAITRDPEIAQDLAHEAFVRLAGEVTAGRAPQNLGAWLHRVAANLAASRGRHLSVVDRRAGELPRPAELGSPEDVVIDAETSATLRGILAELAAAEREALQMAALGYDGLTIASAIGRTPGATRTLMCRARLKVRERLERTGYVRA